MGIFDIFKKNANQKENLNQNLAQKCSECFRPIKGYVWKMNNKPYCQECYNRKVVIVQQTGGQRPEDFDFQMLIIDVFFLRGKGIVIDGIVQKGQIFVDEYIVANGKTFKVRGIKTENGISDKATVGTAKVGLLLDETESADYFKSGDIVTSKRFEDTAPKSNTFVCDVCGKELPVKYRHSGNVCAECYPAKPTPTSKSESAEDNDKSYNVSEHDYLDDITFIRDMKHIPSGPWHQYDVLLAARGYGWDMMKDWADYMAEADLEHISQVTTASLGTQEKDITRSYTDNGGKCKNAPELETEMGVLSVAGMSRTLKAPMKIVWINQTQVLRFFTLIDDELLVKKYVETTIRRTFGTENAMKLGRPIPEGQ